MICTKCSQEVEDGALFCGNCGQPTHSGQAPEPKTAATPQYAVATPVQHSGEVKSLLSVMFGVIGIPASMVPIAGLVLGILGLILGTIAKGHNRKVMRTIGIIASCLAIVVSLAVWAYTLTHQKELSKIRNKPSGDNSTVEARSLISTPCYNIQFGFTLNTDHDKYDNCDVRAFEASSIELSNNVYKVYGNKVISVTEANFEDVSKQAIEKDVSSTLPGFTITGERIAQFAGSPAYIVNAEDKTNHIAVVEAAVLHSGAGYNLFSLVHATKGDSTDFKDLEAAWQWK